ncbi:MAG: hypothetical protein IJS81_04700, partial [Selenomonadaceae bacterium]|nr:hypothetical protein [Selenomonadaceae bacterium]
RYDELNDVGKTWREGKISSAEDFLNLINEGIAQTQRQSDRLKRKSRKLSTNSDTTKEIMRLGSKVAALKSVWNAPVTPALTISQAVKEITDAQNTLESLTKQINEVESAHDAAIANGNYDALDGLKQQSQELQQQEEKTFSHLQMLNNQTTQAILQHAPQALTKVYGKRGNEVAQEDTKVKDVQPSPNQENISAPPIQEDTPTVKINPDRLRTIRQKSESELLDEMSRLDEDYGKIQTALSNATDQETFNKLQRKADVNRAIYEKAQERYDDLHDTGKTWRESDEDVEDIGTAQKILSDEINQTNRKLSRLQSSINQTEDPETLGKLTSQYKNLESRRNNLEQAYQELGNSNPNETLSKVFGKKIKSLTPQEKAQYELDNLNKEREKLRAEKDSAQKSGNTEKETAIFEELGKINKKISDKEGEIKKLKKRAELSPLDKAREELKDLKSALSKEKTSAGKKKNADAKLDSYRKIEEFEEQITEKEKEIAELEKEAQEKSDTESLTKALQKLSKLRSERNEIFSKGKFYRTSSKFKKALESKDKEIEQTENRIKKLKAKLPAEKVEQAEKEAFPSKALPPKKVITPKIQSTGEKVKGIEGKTINVLTDDGKEFKARYKVVEAENLNASHKVESEGVFPNKNYPAELQPRDRGRVTMQANLISIANSLRPEDLMESRNLNQGAPIIRDDGVVLNGNGRTAAIIYAYENNKASNYRQTLINDAEKFGVNRDEVSKMKNPVLVREIVDELTEKDLKSITQSQTGGDRIGASEQARIDAENISAYSLQLYEDNENGDLTTAANYEFVSSVLNDIAGKTDLNAYTTKEGGISKDGYERVKRALFALAYGDSGLIDKIAESTDNNI